MQRLQGKVAIITGGAGGIGEATAALRQRGAKVLPVDIDAGCAQPGRRALDAGERRDLRRRRLLGRGRSATWQKRLTASGGLTRSSATPEPKGRSRRSPTILLEAFDKVMAVNVRGVWLSLQHGVPAWRSTAAAASSSPRPSRD